MTRLSYLLKLANNRSYTNYRKRNGDYEPVYLQLSKSKHGPIAKASREAFDNLKNAIGTRLNSPFVRALQDAYVSNSNESGLVRDSAYTPVQYNVDITDPAKNSQMMGEVANYYNAPKKLNFANSILSNLSFTAPAAKFLTNLHATNTSWKALKEAYGDDPELLNRLSDLRGSTLGPELASNFLNAAITLPLGLYGGYLGMKYIPNVDKKKHRILHALLSGAKFLTGGYLGYLAGKALGHATGLTTYGNSASDTVRNSDTYIQLAADVDKRINEHAKTHDYTTAYTSKPDKKKDDKNDKKEGTGKSTTGDKKDSRFNRRT